MRNRFQLWVHRGFVLGINYDDFPYKHTIDIHGGFVAISVGFGEERWK